MVKVLVNDEAKDCDDEATIFQVIPDGLLRKGKKIFLFLKENRIQSVPTV